MTSLTNLALGAVFAAASLAPVAAQDAGRLLHGQPLVQMSRTAGAGVIAPTVGHFLSAAVAELPRLFASQLPLASSETEAR